MQAATDSGHGSLVHMLTQLIEGKGINIHGQGSLNWGDDADNTALRQAAHRGSKEKILLLRLW